MVPHNVYGVKNDQFCCFASNLCVDYVNEDIDLVEGKIGFNLFNRSTTQVHLLCLKLQVQQNLHLLLSSDANSVGSVKVSFNIENSQSKSWNVPLALQTF